MKITDFWETAPCSIVVLTDVSEVITLMTVHFNETIRYNIPDCFHFHTRCHENLNFHRTDGLMCLLHTYIFITFL
jgi:hypothetical protein